jgi:hypothetical protein
MTLPGSLQGPCPGSLQPKSSGPSFFSKAATSSDHVMASRCYHLCALLAIRLYALAHSPCRQSRRACRMRCWSKPDGTTATIPGKTCCVVLPLRKVYAQRPLKEAAGIVTIAPEIADVSCCVSSMVYLPWLFERSGRCVRNAYRDRLRILVSSLMRAAPWD